MKLDFVLGGITAVMLTGTFCTFSLCMVEDAKDISVPSEYYYSEAAQDGAAVNGDISGEAVQENDTDDETAAADEIIVENEVKELFPSDRKNGSEDEDIFEAEAVQAAVVTEVPYDESTGDGSSAPSYDTYYDDEDDYPVDYDVDEYSDNDTVVVEQDLYGSDEDSTDVISDNGENTAEEVSEETEEIFYDPGTDDNYQDTDIVNEPMFSDELFEEPEDIIITVFDGGTDNDRQQETSVSVSVGESFGSPTGETFTARFDGAVQTVNAYDLICWIVNNEVSGSFSDEAIKAQAVAAYSYVKYHNVNGLTPSVLVKKDPSQRIKDMVSSVWGVCCYYNGSVAQTVYMASSSGYTADAKNVWGGSFPYLKSVACPFDVTSDPNYGLKKYVSESDMRYYLESALGIILSDDPENWIRITGYVDGNYVSSINIDDQLTITGRKMRESVLNYSLRSTAFDVSYENGTFTFTTYGYGHGVGMSQNGANILAKQGYTYDQILKYYFTGIEVL